MKKENKLEGIDTKLPKTLDEAVELLPKLSTSKFVGSVDIDVVLRLKESQKKESVRGSVELPNKIGEDKKVIVFCDPKNAAVALKAGAVKAGLEDLVEEVVNGFSDFEVVVATPDVMAKIVKAGKILGPKGLMPNPKNGTITTDVEKTVKSFKSGKMSFRMTQDQGVIRSKVAKLDMTPEQMKENIVAFLTACLVEAKKLNGANPFKKIVLSPTMGAGLKLDVNDIMRRI